MSPREQVPESPPDPQISLHNLADAFAEIEQHDLLVYSIEGHPDTIDRLAREATAKALHDVEDGKLWSANLHPNEGMPPWHVRVSAGPRFNRSHMICKATGPCDLCMVQKVMDS